MIDQGLPCYGWELDDAEFYVIYGYDDQGYYFSGPSWQPVKGPKNWQELGDTGIGVLEVYSVGMLLDLYWSIQRTRQSG